MLRRPAVIDGARENAHRAVRHASPWIEGLGRLGYAAKGIVYVLVGILAAQAAAGVGGDTTDPRGALAQIVTAPFGKALLALIALGLVGYVVWSFMAAAFNVEDDGDDTKGLATRAGHAIVGVTYAGLALWALGLLNGADAGAGASDPTRDHTAWLMARPLGAWLVGGVGAVVVGLGLYRLVRAWRSDLDDKLQWMDLDAQHRQWVTWAGRAGLAAHGVTLGLIGAFLIAAARDAAPDEAQGLGGALATLAAQPEGPWLLGAVAAGLIGYGLFALVQARYRRFVVS